MAFRGDISINWTLRIITVDAPSTELDVQDLHDTVRQLEYALGNMNDRSLLSTAGKEDLGSGVSVGLSATLQNAKVAFEQRVTKLSTGTVTTPNAAGTILIDSAATFIADGVQPGDMVQNTTDGSSATVASVNSETQLTLVTALTAGVDNQFDSSDAYTVYDWVQCNVSGGNLVSVDATGTAQDPIFPTFGTQVVRTSASSATLQELEDIQHGSFNEGVTIDVTNGTAGTAFPAGTSRQPVNTLADAKAIATSRGFDTIYVVGDLTLGATDVVDGLKIIGDGGSVNVPRTTITLTSGCSTSNTEFFSAYVQGTQGGECRYVECIIGNVANAHCQYERCTFIGPLALLAGPGFLNTHVAEYQHCNSSKEYFVLDYNGSAMDQNWTEFSGHIKVTNVTNPLAEIELHCASAKVWIDSSCTAGTIDVKGIVDLIDESAGATVDSDGVVTGVGGFA